MKSTAGLPSVGEGRAHFRMGRRGPDGVAEEVRKADFASAASSEVIADDDPVVDEELGWNSAGHRRRGGISRLADIFRGDDP